MHSRDSRCLKMLAGIQTGITFQIKLQPAPVKPVYHMAALFRCHALMHHYLPVIFHVAAISTDHAVHPDIPQFFAHLRAASARANVHAMPLLSRLANGGDSRCRNTIFIGH